MSILSNLTIVDSDPSTFRTRDINSMRQKLVDRIGDQISLAQAIDDGKPFRRIRYRRVRDLETDEITETPISTRVRPWWIEDKDGSILVWIKYGNQTLELQKGKSAIKIKSRKELVSTYEKILSAVRSGEFDKLIMGAVETFRSRFGKEKS